MIQSPSLITARPTAPSTQRIIQFLSRVEGIAEVGPFRRGIVATTSLRYADEHRTPITVYGYRTFSGGLWRLTLHDDGEVAGLLGWHDDPGELIRTFAVQTANGPLDHIRGASDMIRRGRISMGGVTLAALPRYLIAFAEELRAVHWRMSMQPRRLG